MEKVTSRTQIPVRDLAKMRLAEEDVIDIINSEQRESSGMTMQVYIRP